MKTENNLEEGKVLDSRLHGNNNKEGGNDPFLLKLRKGKQWLRWVIAIVFLVAIVGGGFLFFMKPKTQGKVENPVADSIKEEEPAPLKFVHQIFDPKRVDHIVPLGDLNGGYNEAQTVNGVMIQMKSEWQKPVEPMEIFAPTNMVLKYYSFMPAQGRETANYQLTFTINEDIELTFHHITSVNDQLKEIAVPTQNSGGVNPEKNYSLKAGELIGRTTGTAGHNWNIYLSDNKQINKFVNQVRYEGLRGRYSFISAICPFDPYEDQVKQLYLSLMGATASGQSKTCGNPSKDVKGTISGLWHLSKETDNSTFMGSYQGQFTTPFSIYRDSAGQIVIYEINRQRYLLGSENPSYKDPAVVVSEHCYNLSQYPGERRLGYAYFKVVSDMEMKLGYSSTGSCPASFPESQSKTYYR